MAAGCKSSELGLSQMPTIADLNRATSVANACLVRGNALVRRARDEQPEHVNTWPREFWQFCQFLESSRGAVSKVFSTLLLNADEPVRHAHLCEATTHSLAWAFAHGVWISGQIAITSALVELDRWKELDTKKNFFLFDFDLVEELAEPIKASVAGCETIDAKYFGSRLLIEARRAEAALQEASEFDQLAIGPTAKQIQGTTSELAEHFHCSNQTIRNRAKRRELLDGCKIVKVRNGLYKATPPRPQNRKK